MKDKNFRLWQVQFDLFQDDKKIWHCRGRLQNADDPIAQKYYYYYYYYDFTVHKTRGNMAIKYEIVTECTEGTPVGGAGALGMDRALQITNNIK